jgi:hypothetical protein
MKLVLHREFQIAKTSDGSLEINIPIVFAVSYGPYSNGARQRNGSNLSQSYGQNDETLIRFGKILARIG